MQRIVVLQIHFNRLEYSKICLNSYFKKVKTSHRLILWDNGSKDGTTEFLRSVQANTKLLKSLPFEVVFVFNDKNTLWADVLNKVWSDHPDAQYLGYCPNDMLIHKDWIHSLLRDIDPAYDKEGASLAVHEAHAKVGVVSDQISDKERQTEQGPFVYAEYTNIIIKDRFGDTPTDCMPSLVRNDLFKKFGPLVELGGMGAYLWFIGKIRENGYTVGWGGCKNSSLIMYHDLLSFEDTPKYKLYREWLHRFKRGELKGQTPPPDMYKDLTYGIR